MTTEQIAELRKQYLPGRFSEYREALRDEARRLGHKVGANDIIKVLEANANDENKIVEGGTEDVRDTRGGDNPDAPKGDGRSDEQGDGKSDGGDGDTPSPTPLPLPKPTHEIKAGTKKLEDFFKGGGEPKGEPKETQPDLPTQQEGGDAKGEGSGSGEDELERKRKELEAQAKAADDAAEAAKRKADEAKRLQKELEELQRKLDEKRKREEEQRKKKEAEQMKNLRHYKTDELIETLKTTGLAYLVGPAGTGKTTLAMDACVELFKTPKDDWKFKKHFAQISFSPDTTSAEMVGRSDINGVFHKSEVVRVFAEGGLILFDEIDNADASMLVKLNTAIANGQFATPEGIVRRHKDTVIVCTANTFGTGPDAMYVGRTRLDAATLDRFILSTIEVDYDKALEKKIAMAIEDQTKRTLLLNFVKETRKTIKDKKFRRLCSTRFVINATKWLAQGKDFDFVKSRFLLGWSENERNAIA